MKKNKKQENKKSHKPAKKRIKKNIKIALSKKKKKSTVKAKKTQRPKKTAKQKASAKKIVDDAIRVERLVSRGKDRGFITYDEILKEFPTVENDIVFLDDLYAKLQ